LFQKTAGALANGGVKSKLAHAENAALAVGCAPANEA
jgi:hypothetical protein